MVELINVSMFISEEENRGKAKEFPNDHLAYKNLHYQNIA